MRYEIAITVRSGRIAWANGPFPSGTNNDLRIFRSGLKGLLRENEFVITDGGYLDTKCIAPPGSGNRYHHHYGLIRARHETLNKRMKQFSVLQNRFRHDVTLHVYCFYAVLNIASVQLEDEPLFEIEL